MARTPKEYSARLSNVLEQEADKLEALIDKAMDERYLGGMFQLDTGKRGIVIHRALLNELQRRYAGWSVRYGSCSDSRDGSSSAWLEFTPKVACGDGDGG